MEPAGDEFQVNPGAEDPSNTVVLTIAAYSNRTIDDFPPLFSSVDPDALDAIVDSMDEGRVSFSHADHVVTVTSEGAVSIEPPDDRADPSGPPN